MLYIDSGSQGCIMKVSDNVLTDIYDMPYIKTKKHRGYDYDTIKELVLLDKEGVVMEEVFTFAGNWSSSNHLILFKGYMKGLCHGLDKPLTLINTRTLFSYIRQISMGIMSYEEKEEMNSFLNKNKRNKETKYLSLYLCKHLLNEHKISYVDNIFQYDGNQWYYINDKGNIRKIHDGVSDTILLWQYHISPILRARPNESGI